MTTFWLKDSKIVVDGSGHPILCTSCPCGGVKKGLYIAGEFTSAASATNRVAYWNGSDWDDVGGGVDGTVQAIRSFGGSLIAVGDMTNYLSVWDGTSWSSSIGSANNQVNDATDMGDLGGLTLFICGNFNDVSGTSAPGGVALWYNGTWYNASSGMAGVPDSLITTAGGDVYCGSRDGNVYLLGGSFPGSLSWSAVGTATKKLADCNSILKFSGTIYNGGVAISAGQPINNYNGSVWVSHGPGLATSATALFNNSGTLTAVLDRGFGAPFSTVEYNSSGTTWVSLTNTHTPRGVSGDFVGRDLVYYPGSSDLVYGADVADDGTTRVAKQASGGGAFAALGSQPNGFVRSLCVLS